MNRKICLPVIPLFGTVMIALLIQPFGAQNDHADCSTPVSPRLPGEDGRILQVRTSANGTSPNDAPRQKVLRVVCDNPEDVGRNDEVFPGRIDWAGGSFEFPFKFSQQDFDVVLPETFSGNNIVRVFFVMDGQPAAHTIFHRSEWYYRGYLRPCAHAPETSTYCVPLSRFRDARQTAAMRRP